MTRCHRPLPITCLLLATLAACASPPPADPAPPASGAGWAAAQTAVSMVGAPYQFGGSSPRGFDCSGLVLYSYAAAGVSGLPHSAARLEAISHPVPIEHLEPGDLLFFQLSEKKTSHVGIYVGNRAFVHAPSSGRRVERVSFDHVYWSTHLGRAGRLGL